MKEGLVVEMKKEIKNVLQRLSKIDDIPYWDSEHEAALIEILGIFDRKMGEYGEGKIIEGYNNCIRDFHLEKKEDVTKIYKSNPSTKVRR